MHLSTDYIHPTPKGGCRRVRVNLSEQRTPPVVLCSELPHNTGLSVTEVAEVKAGEAIATYDTE